MTGQLRSLLLAGFLLAAGVLMADAPVPMRRFAFITGSNDGGDKLVRLKYAESDARSFATVLQDLGGVKPKDLVLVSSPTLQRFEDGLQRVRQMVASPREMDERRELIFYYSGHSDDEGLILGRDRVEWEDLRRQITGIDADVKIAILDSCSSGSLTRAKGGQARPAFLFDASSDMTGHAYLTSASAEEAAQESDRIGSSFFTHYLISGLRGAADTAGDGMVTLNEAYTYAFQETLASTEKTEYGPQHPAYDINLSGSGDLVLTDLRSSSAILKVSDEVAGRLYVRDAQGSLAVELNKIGGQPTELGLEPGVYSVVLDTKTRRMEGSVRVSTKQPAVLTLASLHPSAVDKATARGADPTIRDTPPAKVGSANPAADMGAAIGAVVGAAIGKAMGAVGAAVGAGAAAADEGAQREVTPPGSSPGDSGDGTGSPGPGAGVDPGFERHPPPEAFKLNFAPDISQGFFSSQVDHVVALNILAGTSGTSYGFELAGLANFESKDVYGFQSAGLVNAQLGRLAGFQTAGLVNYVGGEVWFFQSAGLVNVGASLIGGQSAGLVNVINGHSIGGQVAGLVNWSGLDVRGAQVSGVGNWAGGQVNGVQVAGVANWARGIRGPQISVVNVADTVNGAQIGVVNIARHVSGTQIGVINISREIDGVPVGVISIEERGRHALDFWADSDGATATALSLGTRRLYTVFSAGWEPGSTPTLWNFGIGLGTRADVGPAFLDIDLSMISRMEGSTGFNDNPSGSMYPRLRAAVGYPLAGWFAIEAGVTVRALVPRLSTNVPGYDPLHTVFQPAFILGVHIG